MLRVHDSSQVIGGVIVFVQRRASGSATRPVALTGWRGFLRFKPQAEADDCRALYARGRDLSCLRVPAIGRHADPVVQDALREARELVDGEMQQSLVEVPVRA